MLIEALRYREEFGFSIIPVKGIRYAHGDTEDEKIDDGKTPLVFEWKPYQKEKASPEQVRKWWRKYPHANIAIVTGNVSGNLGVIDIDTKEGEREIEQLLPDSYLTPMARTQSGGKHIYTIMPEGISLPNNTKIIPGCDFRGEGGYVVTPPSKGYEWLSSLSIDDLPIAPTPQAYIEAVQRQCNTNINNNSLYRGCGHFVDMFTQGRRDNDLFHVANCLIKGGAQEKEVLQVLNIIARNCNPPFPEKDIKAKVESALKRSKRRDRNLSQEVKEWILSTTGHFLSTDVHTCLQLATRQERKNVSEILRRLCDEKIIERYGNKNGCFRVIDTYAEEINFLKASTECMDIKLPFQIERYVKILPKNIIIIAGSSNSGKTAFLLNVVEMNMSKHDVYYFSSEMGDIELKDRLSKFDLPLTSWKFKPLERSGNFSDVMRPNDINMIDFLEIHDDFWKVGGMIKDIFDKLNKGIAIIAIQKDLTKEYGIGGARSLEKARLYLTMDSHTMKIVKAKNWIHPEINPNGLELKFKLIQGCKFITERDWRKC